MAVNDPQSALPANTAARSLEELHTARWPALESESFQIVRLDLSEAVASRDNIKCRIESRNVDMCEPDHARPFFGFGGRSSGCAYRDRFAPLIWGFMGFPSSI